MVNIGERIKERREELGLTLEEVGTFINVTKATVQRYESGEIDIKRTIAIKLSVILQTTPGYIMGWSDDINSNTINPEQYEFVLTERNYTIFKERLKKRRLELEMNLDFLAAALEIDERMLKSYETGALRSMDMELLKKLCIALQCSILYLFGWEDNPNSVILSPEERELIITYRITDSETQKMIRRILNYYSKYNQI